MCLGAHEAILQVFGFSAVVSLLLGIISVNGLLKHARPIIAAILIVVCCSPAFLVQSSGRAVWSIFCVGLEKWNTLMRLCFEQSKRCTLQLLPDDSLL